MNSNNDIDLNLRNLEDLKLEDYQIEIFKNLKLIGEEIASFYLDGIKIYKSSSFQTKPYLLAHIAREIESGIRDIWASPYRICPHCGKKLSRDQKECECGKYKKLTHREEIAKILNLDPEHLFVKEWHEIAKNFHRFAHRHGPWKKLRDDREINELWEKFERKILVRFIGRFLNLINQVEKFLSFSKPTKEILNTLENVLKNKALANYFFKKLEYIEWLPYLKEKGFFSPEKAPGPEPADKEGFYTIPYWNVLDYLERVSNSKQLKEPGNEIYIDALLEIVKEVTEYHKRTQKLDNYHIWGSFIRILSNLPTNKISMEIIDLIPVWLDSKFDTMLQAMEIMEKLFPRFLTNNSDDIQKAEQIIKYFTEIKVVKRKSPEPKHLPEWFSKKIENAKKDLEKLSSELKRKIQKFYSEEFEEKILLVDIYLLKEFFENHLDIIAEKCSIKLIDIFVKRLKELVPTEYRGTLNSLYDYEEAKYLLERPVELFTYILSKILLIKTEKEPENVRQILESFFKEAHPIFTKIALFVIGQNIDTFKDIFWKVIKNKEDKIFEGAVLFWGDELKKVLENLGPLDKKQKRLLKEEIEIAADKYVEMLEDKDEKEKEKWKVIFKQMIYKALSYDEKFKTLHDTMKQITETDIELHPAIGKTEIKIGWGESPLSVEKILEMDNEELAKYLIQFKTIDFWEGPTVEALAETLRTAVKTNPKKFTENLDPFLKIGYLYVARILEGFQEALKENKPIDYEKIFNFIEMYINQEKFWQDKFKVQSSMPVTHRWVITAFYFFLTEALKNREYPLPERLFEKVEHIIHLMLQNLKIESDKIILDYPQYSINTPLGRIIEVYIKFVLKVLQSSYDKKEFVKNRFIEKYKGLLDHQIIEAYTFFGMYFLNFYFHIDKDFTTEIVKSLKKGEENWGSFMQGYLFIGRIYRDIYNLMKDHYEFALSYNFKSNVYREQLIQHISLAYLISLESLKSPSLFNKLMEKFDSDDINQIIWFFWRQKDYLKEDNEKNKQIKKRILDFWQFVYDKLKEKREEHLSEKEKEILSNIVKLTVFLPELSEPYTDWLKLSTKFIKNAGTFSVFLNDVEKFIKIGDRIETAKIIGELLLNVKPFTYPKDKIKSFIKYLCETDDGEVKKIAKDICEKYIKSEIFFLKEVCEKCN